MIVHVIATVGAHSVLRLGRPAILEPQGFQTQQLKTTLSARSLGCSLPR